MKNIKFTRQSCFPLELTPQLNRFTCDWDPHSFLMCTLLSSFYSALESQKNFYEDAISLRFQYGSATHIWFNAPFIRQIFAFSKSLTQCWPSEDQFFRRKGLPKQTSQQFYQFEMCKNPLYCILLAISMPFHALLSRTIVIEQADFCFTIRQKDAPPSASSKIASITTLLFPKKASYSTLQAPLFHSSTDHPTPPASSFPPSFIRVKKWGFGQAKMIIYMPQVSILTFITLNLHTRAFHLLLEACCGWKDGALLASWR